MCPDGNGFRPYDKVCDVTRESSVIQEGLPIARDSSLVANIPIMYGCNNFCSYCIVPYVRGRERSRKVEDVLEEVRGVVKEGYKEIMLLGQNVNSYAYGFANLLYEIDKVDGIEKIHFLSPHPKDFTDEVVQAIAKIKKVSRFIHLPLQAGSTNTLQAMNRKYTKEQFLALAQKIKSEIPETVFSTDIIVGFPGETDEDFEDTLDVVRTVGFRQVFMFIYSKRVGTPAEKMENQILEEVKHERLETLKNLVNEIVNKEKHTWQN